MKEGLSERLFINRLCNESKAGEKFCFILGSGASWSSGIPTGREFMRHWREELLAEEEHTPGYLSDLCRQVGLSPEEFDRIVRSREEPNSEDYFTLYDLRFEGKPVEAAQYLENAMANKFPGCGHCFLATFLHKTPNRLVITTNFDSLVEDALFIYHSAHPRVLGHESLAPFLSSNLNRPVVAKIHRDLFLAPKNRKKELENLEEAWKAPLTKVLSEYIPIVIGYGGGDQTLMSLLEQIQLRNIYWCLRNEKPSPRIEKILEQNHGEWVPILGFDELLFQINERYPYKNSLGDPGQYIVHVAEERRKKFNSSVDKVKERYATVEKEWISGISADTTGVAAAVIQFEERTECIPRPRPEVETQIYTIRLELARDHFQKVLDLCTEALSKHPEEPRLYYLRSTAYHQLGNYTKALEDASKAIQLDPENPKYYMSRAATFFQMMHYEASLEDNRKAIQLDVNNPRYYLMQSATLYSMERYEEALETASKALQLNPDEPMYYCGRSLTLRAMGRYEESLVDIGTAIQLDPNNPTYYADRSLALSSMNSYDDALSDANKTIQLCQNNASYYNNRSLILGAMGFFKKALIDINQAIRLDPDKPNYYDSRAITLRALGRTEEAQQDEEQARALRAGASH